MTIGRDLVPSAMILPSRVTRSAEAGCEPGWPTMNVPGSMVSVALFFTKTMPLICQKVSLVRVRLSVMLLSMSGYPAHHADLHVGGLENAGAGGVAELDDEGVHAGLVGNRQGRKQAAFADENLLGRIADLDRVQAIFRRVAEDVGCVFSAGREVVLLAGLIVLAVGDDDVRSRVAVGLDGPVDRHAFPGLVGVLVGPDVGCKRAQTERRQEWRPRRPDTTTGATRDAILRIGFWIIQDSLLILDVNEVRTDVSLRKWCS